MRRVLLFAVLLVVLVAGAVWLADRPGAVMLEWGGWRIETTAAVLALAVALVAVLAALAYRGWRFLRRLPARVGAARREGRRRRGYLALTRGMVAVAAGDGGEAARQARKAQGLLADPPLTLLLQAQASQLAGDEGAAARFFAAMAERPETEFLGLRGLLTHAMRKGDRAEALRLARRAQALRPDAEWAASTRLELELEQGHWEEAAKSLEHAMRKGAVAASEGRRKKAALAYQTALEADARGERGKALRRLRKALSDVPEFTPAALRLARLLLDEGKDRRAASVVLEAWRAAPHPDLPALFYEARGAEDALARVRAAGALAEARPKHPESHLAVVAAALEAQLWGEARKHLQAAAGETPSARVCRLMAELEEAEHGDLAAARGWLMRATRADPDPAWVCDDCGHTVAVWTALCGKCGALDSLTWRTPPHATPLAAAETAALPYAATEEETRVSPPSAETP